MGNYMWNFLAALILWGGSFLAFAPDAKAQSEKPDSPPASLADAFGNPEPVPPPAVQAGGEVEPVVVGRRKWSDRAAKEPVNNLPPKPADKTVRIEELDPLETQQPKLGKIDMPNKPPIPLPAVNLHRNFEGTLVLKPRKLGFQRDFPFQLENTRGKRLAFIDVGDIRIIDPLDFKDQKVNVLGKLEAIKKGSDELVIRARLLRKAD
jgi:hypothetical protein